LVYEKVVFLLLAVFLGLLFGGCNQAPQEPDRLFQIIEKGKVGYKVGYMDRTGRVVIPPQFIEAHNFSEGLAGVRLGWGHKQYGYIDTNGKVVILPRFDYVDNFSNGLARVYLGGKWGFIDRTGKVIVPVELHYAENFSEGLAGVWGTDKKWGYIDTTGKMVIPPRFDWGYNFAGGLAAVKLDKKWGFIDQHGNMVISPQFDGGMSQLTKGNGGLSTGEGRWSLSRNLSGPEHFPKDWLP
jgi:hypothetical protein